MISTTYTLETINDLLTLSAEERADGYARLIKSEASWYIFLAFATRGLLPNDEPVIGRWVKANDRRLKPVAEDYWAVAGDRLLANSNNNSGETPTVYLPSSPQVGDEVEIISNGSLIKINLNGSSIFGGNFGAILGIGYKSDYQLFKGGTLIFGSRGYGNNTWDSSLDFYNNRNFYFVYAG